MSKKQVPVQKGKIDPNPKTMKTMTYSERVSERQQELQDLKRGQTMEFKTPK